LPARAWTPAVEPDGKVRHRAWVAELAGDVLKGWPSGMRLIVRKERPHPGGQLRFTDADGMRLTCCATNTKQTPIARLELRHRQRARAEDRIREVLGACSRAMVVVCLSRDERGGRRGIRGPVSAPEPVPPEPVHASAAPGR
jgi:hypothetical protein